MKPKLYAKAAAALLLSAALTFVAELHRHPESFSILDKQSGQILYSTGGNRPAI